MGISEYTKSALLVPIFAPILMSADSIRYGNVQRRWRLLRLRICFAQILKRIIRLLRRRGLRRRSGALRFNNQKDDHSYHKQGEEKEDLAFSIFALVVGGLDNMLVICPRNVRARKRTTFSSFSAALTLTAMFSML